MAPKRSNKEAESTTDSSTAMQVDPAPEGSSSPPPYPSKNKDQKKSESESELQSSPKSKGKGKEKEKEAPKDSNNGWSDEEDEEEERERETSKRGGVDPTLEEPLSPDLIASLPVYLSTSLPSTSSIHVFQYPIFNKENPLPVPSQARSAGLNETIRWRPKANRIEIELPIDDRPSVYDSEKGRKFGKGAKIEKEIGNEIKVKKEKEKERGRNGMMEEEKKESNKLRKTRLESNEIPHTTGYMIGIIRDGALHLTPVESIIQLRPSMHYLDEIDKLNKESGRRGPSNSKAGGEELSDVEMSEGNQSSGEQKEVKPKAKAMAMHASVKAGEIGKGGPGDRDTLMRAQRLADGEAWVDLEWAGQESSEADNAFRSKLFASTKSKLECKTKPREYLPQM